MNLTWRAAMLAAFDGFRLPSFPPAICDVPATDIAATAWPRAAGHDATVTAAPATARLIETIARG